MMSPEQEKELTKEQIENYMATTGAKLEHNKGCKYVDIDIANHLNVNKVQCLCHPMKMNSNMQVHYPKTVRTTYDNNNAQRKHCVQN